MAFGRFDGSEERTTFTFPSKAKHAAADLGESFSVTLVTLSGQTQVLEDLHPSETVASLRSRAGKRLDMAAPLLTLCVGSRALKSEDSGLALWEVGISEASVITCIRAKGTALGEGRFALTAHTFRAEEDLPAAVRREFGDAANVADFSALMLWDRGELERFLDGVGLHGCAFVQSHGSPTVSTGSGGHYFVCRHSGGIPPNWLVQQEIREDDGYGLGALDLCWKSSGLMPVLVDLGPA